MRVTGLFNISEKASVGAAAQLTLRLMRLTLRQLVETGITADRCLLFQLEAV